MALPAITKIEKLILVASLFLLLVSSVIGGYVWVKSKELVRKDSQLPKAEQSRVLTLPSITPSSFSNTQKTPVTQEQDTDNQELETLARNYIQAIEMVKDGKKIDDFFQQSSIFIFDLRSEDDYLKGHIKYSLRISYNGLKLTTAQGTFENKDVVIITNGNTDEIKTLEGDLRSSGVKSVYLYPNFDPDKLPEELIKQNLTLRLSP